MELAEIQLVGFRFPHVRNAAVKPMVKWCAPCLLVHRLTVWILYMNQTSAVPSAKMVSNLLMHASVIDEGASFHISVAVTVCAFLV